MSEYAYIKMSCSNCESEYAVDFITGNTDGDPDYCPFCGEEMPETVVDPEEETSDGDDEDESW